MKKKASLCGHFVIITDDFLLSESKKNQDSCYIAPKGEAQRMLNSMNPDK